MVKHSNLTRAKQVKKDDFYTKLEDIEKELTHYKEHFRGKTVLLPCDDYEHSNFTNYFKNNFKKLGLAKLISTCYNPTGNGKIETVSEGLTDRGVLKGNGDFRSEEITKLKESADIIITNPPFSLFRSFMEWVNPREKKICIIGNINALTYKEIIPLILENRLWLGASIHSGDRTFYVPKDYPLNAHGCGVDNQGNRFIRVKGVRWFTNVGSYNCPKPLELSTKDYNLKHNSKLKKKLDSWNISDYPKYDNYDAIEVPFTECIPCDYDGVMGVPITFLDKYNPNQFEILGITQRNNDPYRLKKYTKAEYKNASSLNSSAVILVNGIPKSVYARILIRNKNI